MPDINKLIPQIQRASMIQKTHPGRKGRLLEIPEGDSILVAGDLHGQLDILRRILLRADLGANPRRHLLLQEVIHGPNRYPDGSDKSHQALDLVAALVCQYPGRVHFLPGNHELAQIHGRLIMKNDQFLNESFSAGLRHAFGDRSHEMIEAYTQFIETSPLALRTPNRVFLSHSLPKAASLALFDLKNFELPELTKTDFGLGGIFYGLFWDRETAESTAVQFLEKVNADWLITGHIPCQEGFSNPSPRHIILDSHAFPAAVAMVPMDRPIGPEGIVGCIEVFKV